MTAYDSFWQLPCLSSSQELRSACYVVYVAPKQNFVNEYNIFDMFIAFLTKSARIRKSVKSFPYFMRHKPE